MQHMERCFLFDNNKVYWTRRAVYFFFDIHLKMWPSLRRVDLLFRGDLFVDTDAHVRQVQGAVVLTPLRCRVLTHARQRLVFFLDGVVFVTYGLVQEEEERRQTKSLALFWERLEEVVDLDEANKIKEIAKQPQFNLVEDTHIANLRSMLLSKVNALVIDEEERAWLQMALAAEGGEELYGVMLTADDALVVRQQMERACLQMALAAEGDEELYGVIFRRNSHVLHYIDEAIRDRVVKELNDLDLGNNPTVRIHITCTPAEAYDTSYIVQRMQRIAQNFVPPHVRIQVAVAKPGQMTNTCTVRATSDDQGKVDLTSAMRTLQHRLPRFVVEDTVSIDG